MKKISLLPSLIVASALIGCLGPRGYPPREGIGNYDQVNEALYRGAQPDEVGLQSLQRLGVKSIINLRLTNDLWLPEEAIARAAGMTYTNIPMDGFARPTEEQVGRVLSSIGTLPAPVFVHCKYGCDRTGAIIACYRIDHDGWSSEAALREADQHGMSWREFAMKAFVRAFGKARRSD